jgi:nitrite reductase/ring-hydroxylating ferredoxin subunit/DMSO/TMAO reductase YedYZ heme-binding membrane subunit
MTDRPKYYFIEWNRQKQGYDFALAAILLLAGLSFVAITLALNPNTTPETLIIRTTSLLSFVLLHVILIIGPLSRLDRRFLPLLYNRRHLGVTMFLLAMVHAVMATMQYHGFGDENPLVSIFTAYQRDYDPFLLQSANISNFPFEPFGFFALIILFLMAATSHDYWLKQLGASTWKFLHLLVYLAYGLLVFHVAFGVLQSERNTVYAVLLAAGFILIVGVHIAAGFKERAVDKGTSAVTAEGFVAACSLDELNDGEIRTVATEAGRIALARTGDEVHALSNVCAHQGGPVGEGTIENGCVTCPWHGWQFRLSDGRSPAPYEDEIPTYPVRIIDGTIFVKAKLDRSEPAKKDKG